jgi:hypothetical protein
MVERTVMRRLRFPQERGVPEARVERASPTRDITAPAAA